MTSFGLNSRLAAILLIFINCLTHSTRSVDVDIFTRVAIDSIDPTEQPFDLISYLKNYTKKPLTIGIVTYPSDADSSIPMHSNPFGQVSVKTRDIPGPGYITHYECQVTNPGSGIKFGVLKHDENDVYTLGCVVEVLPGTPSFDDLDLIPLSKPCEVNHGDHLVVFQDSNINPRCSTYDAGANPAVNYEIGYSTVVEGLEVSSTAFTTVIDNDLAIAFNAIFDSGMCHTQYLGHPLQDRPINTLPEDVTYIDGDTIIEGGVTLKGVALYIENANDQSGVITILDEADHDVVLCAPLTILPNTVGVTLIDYPTPCVIGPGTSGVIQLETLSRAEEYEKNVLSYSESQEVNCLLTVNGRDAATCNRIYSIQVYTDTEGCYSQVEKNVDAMDNNAHNIQPEAALPECIEDFTGTFKNMVIGSDNSGSLKGPLMYIDLANPLQSGIVDRILYHYPDYASDDTFHAVIWRRDANHPQEFHVVCHTIAGPDQEDNIGESFMPDGCKVKEMDYVGFIYNGTNNIPLSFSTVDPSNEEYLSVKDDQNIMSIGPVFTDGTYAFSNSAYEYKFNIAAQQCIVQPESKLNLETKFDDIPYQYFVGNNLYTRSRTETDSLIVLDKLNIIPFPGAVTAFALDPNYQSTESTLMMMVRPIYSEQNPEEITRVEVVCSKSIIPNGQSLYTLDEECIVHRGDMLAISSLGSQSSVSYDKIVNYECEYLDQLLNVITDQMCDRMFSMGFQFEKILQVEMIGNEIIDRPYSLFDTNRDNSNTEFTYLDKTIQLTDGVLTHYVAYIEDHFDTIQFEVTDGENTGCVFVTDYSPAYLGKMNYFETDRTQPDCHVTSAHQIRVKVTNGPYALGMSCDMEYDSEVSDVTGTLSLNAMSCENKIKLSIGVDVVDENATRVMSGMQKIPKDDMLQDFADTTDANTYGKRSECSAGHSTYGIENLSVDGFYQKPLMYVDMKSDALNAGFLESWKIVVTNSSQPLVTVVWRQIPDSNAFQIVCHGLASNSDVSSFQIEKVYPSHVCKVEDGDRIGFVALNDNSMENIRVGYTRDENALCKSIKYEGVFNTPLLDRGIYTLIDDDECMNNYTFAIQANVCLEHNNGECKHGEEVINESTIEIHEDPAMDMGAPLVHIDTSKSLQQGEFLSWKLVVGNPLAPLYPVVWHKESENRYRVACLSYDDDPSETTGDLVDILPRNKCLIDDDNYYVGFLTTNVAENSTQRVYHKVPEVDDEDNDDDADDDDGAQNNDPMPMLTTVTLLNMPDMSRMVNQELELDVSSLPENATIEDDRHYQIIGQVCGPKIMCSGDATIESTSDITLDRVFVADKFEEAACLSSIQLNSIRSDVEFALMVFTPSQGLDVNAQQMTVLHSKILRTSTVGLESYSLGSENLCAPAGSLIGFSFYNRRMPFKTSTEVESDVNYAGFNTKRSDLYTRGDKLSMSKNSNLGKAPVKLCFTENQIIGQFDESGDSSNMSFFFYNNADTYRLSLLNYNAVAIDGRVKEFSAHVSKPGRVHFLALSNLSNTSYKVKNIWSFDASMAGVNSFWPSQEGDESLVSAGDVFAVAARNDELLLNVDFDTNDVILYTNVSIEEIAVDDTIELGMTIFKPVFGARIGFDIE